MALQLTATNGRALRALTSWIARATNSLPVPDSPATSTGAMLRATLSTIDRTCCIAAERPAIRLSAWLVGAITAPLAKLVGEDAGVNGAEGSSATGRAGRATAAVGCSEGRLAGTTV